MKKIFHIICFIFLATATAGCWNLQEPNQRAFIIGAGLDMTKDGHLEISSQVAIPAGLGSSQDMGASKEKTFTVISAEGRDFMDAGQHLQAKLTRTLFYAHRQTILIGHRMAEQGLDKYLDMIVRNPKSEIRSVMLVVKDGTAKDILSTEPIFDPFISTTLSNLETSLGMKPYYYRYFLCDAFSEGTQTIIPAVTAAPSNGYVYAGSAILDKDHGLKLVGYLNPEESVYDNWMMGRQKYLTVTAVVGKRNETISLRVQSLKHRTRVKMVKNRPQIHISLHGVGSIVENNSSLDPSREEELKKIQSRLSQEAENKVRKLVAKAQHQYKLDIFGFGEQVHWKFPRQWKSLKPHWHETFSEMPITVSVHLEYRNPGQTNSSI